jgi:predicted DCC family thiol-disulfide oxidoreductase YuxK
MKKLHVLYDAQDDFALRSFAWLVAQPAVWPLEFVPFQASERMARFEGIDVFQRRGPLLVVSDEGGVYAGPNAFIICLYALEDYQEWSYRLAAPMLLPLARRAFELLSTQGRRFSRVMEKLDDAKLAWLLEFPGSSSTPGQSPLRA